MTAQELMSYIQSDPVLRQSSHAQILQDQPEWALILGLGYHTKAQKQSLIYKHLNKLVDTLHTITAGDPTKAKQLSEMLCLRTHAGMCFSALQYSTVFTPPPVHFP